MDANGHTGQTSGDAGKAGANDASAGWARVGEAVRKARVDMGYTNRQNFADAVGVSVRVLADIEAGTRTNFSDRVLHMLETNLSWPSGTVAQIVADPGFQPPSPGSGADLLFRPPLFSRRPVPVDVALIERSIIALTEAERAAAKPGSAEASLAAALVAQCWPYIIRLVEDNCLPGKELHPAVRPLYETFARISDWAAPGDPTGKYAQWLAGDDSVVPETVRTRYMQRWSESRRVVRGRRNENAEEHAPATWR